jgi:hypothetical protein
LGDKVPYAKLGFHTTLILMNAKLYIQTQTWRSCSECFSFETFGTILPTLPEYDDSTCQQFQNSSAEGSRLQSGPCCSWSDCGIDFVVWITMDGGISSSFPEPCAQPCHTIKIHAHQVQLIPVSESDFFQMEKFTADLIM